MSLVYIASGKTGSDVPSLMRFVGLQDQLRWHMMSALLRGPETLGDAADGCGYSREHVARVLLGKRPVTLELLGAVLYVLGYEIDITAHPKKAAGIPVMEG